MRRIGKAHGGSGRGGPDGVGPGWDWPGLAGTAVQAGVVCDAGTGSRVSHQGSASAISDEGLTLARYG